MDRKSVGQIGEDIACGYLVDKGYQIIGRNYREKFGEIDIITKSPDKTLVFVEVKTITIPVSPVDKSPASYPHLAGLESAYEDKLFTAEDHLNPSKLTRFKKISQWYANKHPELISGAGYELDAITITLENGTAGIKHYKNIL